MLFRSPINDKAWNLKDVKDISLFQYLKIPKFAGFGVFYSG